MSQTGRPSAPARRRHPPLLVVGVVFGVALAIAGTTFIVELRLNCCGGWDGFPPIITAGSAVPFGIGVRIPILSVRGQAPVMDFKLNLWVNDTHGPPVNMPLDNGEFVVVSSGAANYRINWTDHDGSATISTGDSFEVTHTASTEGFYLPFAGDSRYRFTLYRAWDGLIATSVNFTAP